MHGTSATSTELSNTRHNSTLDNTVFVKKSPLQMTEPAHMANALQTELLPKTLNLRRVLFAPSDDNGIQNTLSIGRVTLAPYKAQGSDGTNWYGDTQNASNRGNEDETDGNDARIIGEFPVQHVGKHVGTGRGMKYIDRWCGYRPKKDIIEALPHIAQHFVARYWSVLSRQKIRRRRDCLQRLIQ